jgi:hypothetical protein
MPHLRIILQRVFFRWGLVFQVAAAGCLLDGQAAVPLMPDEGSHPC